MYSLLDLLEANLQDELYLRRGDKQSFPFPRTEVHVCLRDDFQGVLNREITLDVRRYLKVVPLPFVSVKEMYCHICSYTSMAQACHKSAPADGTAGGACKSYNQLAA